MGELELDNAKDVKDYFVFAVIAVLFNPLFGAIAIFTSLRCRKEKRQDRRLKAIFYADLSFGFSIVSVISTVIIIVLVYAFHYFPEHTYYDRDEIIGAK